MTEIREKITSQVTAMIALARSVQDQSLTEEERKQLIDKLNVLYSYWLGDIESVMYGSEREKLLEREYQGSLLTPGIRSFLERGWMLYSLYSENNPFTPRWVVDVERGFVNRINEQLRVVIRSL